MACVCSAGCGKGFSLVLAPGRMHLSGEKDGASSSGVPSESIPGYRSALFTGALHSGSPELNLKKYERCLRYPSGSHPGKRATTVLSACRPGPSGHARNQSAPFQPGRRSPHHLAGLTLMHPSPPPSSGARFSGSFLNGSSGAIAQTRSPAGTCRGRSRSSRAPGDRRRAGRMAKNRA